MANTHLPLGLTRYAGGRFEQLHGLGCRCITASSIADLYGLGRNGRLALWAHVAGVMAIESKETMLTRRGKKLQRVVAEMYAEDTKRPARTVHAWIKHPTMAYYASPDLIDVVAGQHRPGEIKVVAQQVFDETWQDGPPLKVLLQHQAQLDLTGQPSGPVIASPISDFVFDAKPWDVEANSETQALIRADVEDFLASIESGDMPSPDLANEQDQEAVIRLAHVTEGMVVDLPDELLYHVRRYQRAGTIARACEKRRKEAKARLIDALGGAQLGVFENGQTVKLNVIEYGEQVRKAYSAARINIGQQKTAKRAA